MDKNSKISLKNNIFYSISIGLDIDYNLKYTGYRKIEIQKTFPEKSTQILFHNFYSNFVYPSVRKI